MQKKFDIVKQSFLDILLSAGIGCVSYYLLVYLGDNLLVSHTDQLLNAQTFAGVIVVFVCLGFIIRYINIKITESYRFNPGNSHILSRSLVSASVILAAANYLLFVSAKFIAGIDNPFALHFRGIIVLIIIWLIEMLIVRQSLLNHFYKDLIRLYKQSKDYEEKNVKANYMALQNQLNPHFLFNSLNTLVSEIEYNPKVAAAFTRNLADVYRYILNCQNKKTISLCEELDFIDKYIMLHKVRLGDCITIDNKLDNAFLEYPVPPLTLQLLIENIIKHNIISISKPMVIHLYTEEINEQVWLCVKNQMRIKIGVASSGKGLDNLDQRFRLIYNTPIQIVKDDNEFTVKVPLRYE